MKKRLSIKGVDVEAIQMLRDLKEEESRFMGAILTDAITDYWYTIFEDETVEESDR